MVFGVIESKLGSMLLAAAIERRSWAVSVRTLLEQYPEHCNAGRSHKVTG